MGVSQITIQPQGQVLSVTLTGPGSATEDFHLNASLSSAVTFPLTIGADTTLYTANDGNYTLSVKRLDGTELRGDVVRLAMDDPIVVAPQPSAAQVAASSVPEFIYRTGQSAWYLPLGSTSTTTGTVTIDRMFCMPWRVPNTISIDRIGCEITSTGGAGSVVRLGVYRDDNGLPGALVVDAGAGVNGTSATVQSITISATELVRGNYWLAVAAQVGTTPTFRMASVGPDYQIPMTSAPTANQLPGCVYQASVSGAFPATFGTPVVASIQAQPRIHIRVA